MTTATTLTPGDAAPTSTTAAADRSKLIGGIAQAVVGAYGLWAFGLGVRTANGAHTIFALKLDPNASGLGPLSFPAQPATRPAQTEWVIDAVSAAANAPNRNCPSTAMLTTPERSLSNALIEPSTSGTAPVAVSWMIDGTFRPLAAPAAAHTRNESTKERK